MSVTAGALRFSVDANGAITSLTLDGRVAVDVCAALSSGQAAPRRMARVAPGVFPACRCGRGGLLRMRGIGACGGGRSGMRHPGQVSN